ncbi:MAG TPA: 2-hydroxyglutaryl-CoA dehydratase [Clostridiales bacterium]|nr:2-hydroxyglutaryl-CoA dehydratase [Clostridiales bacterium]
MGVYAGVDIGSATAKAVVIDDATPAVILGTALIPVGFDSEAAGKAVLEQALCEAGLGTEALERVVTTGYGRHAMAAEAAVTEITCHARGAAELVPEAGSVIDVGGQDSKAMSLGPGGRVLDFVMNDKCAAGTGRFLEVMARALEVRLDEFGPLSLKAERAADISNTCTVFAESEVISQRAARTPREEIIAGIHKAMARRIAGMARRTDLRPVVVMSGGVARNIGLVRAVEAELGMKVVVPELAQYAGALGAALLARERP